MNYGYSNYCLFSTKILETFVFQILKICTEDFNF